MKSVLGVLGLVVFSAGLLGASGPVKSAEPVDFNRDIRPIITKCFACHGPDSQAGSAGLRLDSFAGATKKLDSGKAAIVPGKPDQSEFIKRIYATDDSQMPPVDSHKKLSAEEKELLRNWIAQGAEYKEHWAFVKPVRPAVPSVQNAKWAKNEIDNFVLSKLEKKGLKPEAEADKPTLIRRISLDLTGLPQTPEEVDAFTADRSPNAYEKVVDRLLASPRFGERMAMDWMDYSRYADSNGYQADYERFQSRWRDWVIEAFNSNMPYDKFTVDQIAGDMRPNATTAEKLATGFNRNHRINTEGGVIAEEWRVETVVDRVETTSAVWFGLTTGCARCHDHKYDPFTQKDFYKMYSYFNNVPETGSGEERPISHPPVMRAPTAEQEQKTEELKTTIKKLDAQMATRIAKNQRAATNWKFSPVLPAVSNGLIARYKLAAGGKDFTVGGKARFSFGRATGSVKTNNENFLDLGDVANFERDQTFSFGAWIKPDQSEGSAFSRMDSQNAYRGWDLSVFSNRPQAHLISKWTENAVKIAARNPIKLGAWTHVLITYDGSSKAAGFKMYLNGSLAEVVVERDTLTDSIKTPVSAKIGRRTNSDFFSGEVDDFVLFNRALQPDEAKTLASAHPGATLLTIPAIERTKEQQLELTRLWSRENDKAFAAFENERDADNNALEKLQAQIPEVMVMREMEKPRESFVLQRGQYDMRGEKVEPGLPSFLPALPKGAPNNRLGFALWVVSSDNPLTSRVTVNRLWERFFGGGIVSTVEDFGTRAEFPSHPELLDHLALRFIDLKWNLKAIIKEMAMSATYRQASTFTAAKMEADPLNKLLSRGPRYRLPGEVIRDQALFVSGLLKEKLGGPSVYPYQPTGIWDETNFYGNLRNYMPAKGDGLYRRSLYTIWKRTAAPPNMLLFDVPSREACRVQRARTDTPLQALTLMNDETYLEAARVLAQMMLRTGGTTPESRLTYGFRRVLGRFPTPGEISILTKGLNARLARFKADPAAARDLTLVGAAPIDMGLSKIELAAYTVSASALLNLDETVTKE